jgi:hypothetical protein
MSEEVLDIKFYTSKEDDKDIIRYNIDGRYEGIFIDKDGKLVGSITGNLTESLKNNTTMLGIYKNYLKQNSLSTKFANAASSVSQRVSSVVGDNPIFKNMREQASLISKNIPKVYSNGGSKKTKSKRSANANKTLKNRK